MGKINFVKSQRPTPIKSFDGVYNNGGELSIGTQIFGSKKLYFVYNAKSGTKSSYYGSEMEAKNQLNKMKNNLIGGMTYGDGGEVAEKIKSRLAKGSFELPMEMIVYVPSTKDGNVIIPKGDFQARVKNVRAFLATKFGGFSSNPTDGGYMSNDNKGLIEEDVVKVTAFATKEALEENLSPLLKKIQYWCRAWSQESIGFEFEGDLFYISATSKFMGGGMTYRNGSKTWIVMAVTNNGLLLSERLNESITHEEVYNRYKKQGYEVVDSQVLHTTNSDVLDVFKDAVTEFVLEKYDKQIDWDLSILSYKIIDNKMIVGKCVVTTIDGNEYEISPNDLLNNKYAKGGMTYNGGGMTEDQDNRTMIMRQAKEVTHHVEELNEILSKQPDIDAWVVAKMQDVTTQLSEVTHYLDSRVGFRLGGDDIQKVQDSMLANGARLDRKKIVVILKDKDLGYDYYTIKDYMTGEHIASIKGLSSAEQYVDSQEYRLQYAEDWEDEDSMLANGAKLKSKENNFSDDTDMWFDEVAEDAEKSFKNDMVNVRKIIEITNKEATRPNLESLEKAIDNARFIQSSSKAYMKNQIKSILSGQYKNEFRFHFGGKRSGGGKKSATSEFFSMVYQAITYQVEIAAHGAKLKSGKLTLSKLKSMIEEYNSQGRNFELLGAYNQLELWSNDNRLETGSKEDIYRALVRYRFNPKYANGAKLPIDMEEIPNFGSMSDEDIIEFANTVSYYDRMDEGIEEEFTNVEDAMEYLRMTYEGE